MYGDDDFEATFLATGSEVELAVNTAKKMKEDANISLRVVSMPSAELFKNQALDYQTKILPCEKPVIAIEMGATMGWYQFADAVYGIDDFGRSGKGEEVQEYFGFSVEKLSNYYLKYRKNFD